MTNDYRIYRNSSSFMEQKTHIGTWPPVHSCKWTYLVWLYDNYRNYNRQHNEVLVFIKPLTPKDPYRGRTAPLTCKVAFYIFIQQI